jgi:hypothetical protein
MPEQSVLRIELSQTGVTCLDIMSLVAGINHTKELFMSQYGIRLNNPTLYNFWSN